METEDRQVNAKGLVTTLARNMVMDLEVISCPCCTPSPPARVWVDEGRGTQYRKCSGCGTIYASPRTSRANRLAAFVQGWGEKPALRIAAMRIRALERIATSLQQRKRGGKLLDVGCSTGAFFEFFDTTQWVLHGVEVAPTAAAYAAQKTGAIVHNGDLLSARYPSGYFDLVTILDSFYYFDDPFEQLREATRVLSPGGILGIEIPGRKWAAVRSRGPLCLLLSGTWCRLASDSHYLFIYSSEGIRQLARRVGLRVVAQEVVASPRTFRWTDLLAALYYTAMRPLVRSFPHMIE